MAYSKELLDSLAAKGQLLRRDCIKCIGVGVAGHVGGSCSAADLVAALYFYKMKYDPKNPEWEGRDYFLLSKGHVAILQYSALAEAGFFPVEDLLHCKDVGFYLQGHPHLGTPASRPHRLSGPGPEPGPGHGHGPENGRQGQPGLRAGGRR